MLARLWGKTSALEIILSSRYKNNIDYKLTCNVYTSSHYACVPGYVGIVECLIRHIMFLPKATDNTGHTPLYAASQKCQLDIVRRLLNTNDCDTVRLLRC